MALTESEAYWRDKQPWLLSCGYQLRPRFQPDWTPSWVTDPPPDTSGKLRREDYISRGYTPVMDAIHVKDNVPVVLKKIRHASHKSDSEHILSEYLTSPELMEDPDNHCVPIYEVLQIPHDHDSVIIVMPLLRPFHSTRFDTIGECLDLFYQMFKGLQFLHHRHIAHRDCTANNLMMDPSELYPDGFHPVEVYKSRDAAGPAVQKYTRTQRPPKYYWIDFGLSIRFNDSDKFPRAVTLRGGDKSPPEFRDMAQVYKPRDPFPTDIYYLGNIVRMYFTEGSQHLLDGRKYGLGFMKPLVDSMVQDDMSKRPTIDQCVIHLEEIIRSQSSCTLRAQIWHSTDNPIGFIYRFFPHWARRIIYIVTQKPAVPSWSRRSKSAPPTSRIPR